MNIRNKILIIEDDKVMHAALRDMLINNNYIVESAYEGNTGLELVRSWQPDLLLLDLNLPLLSGVDIMKALRHDMDKWGTELKVIILTNLGMNSRELDQVTMYNPAYYLIKSEVELEDVLGKVKDCLA